MPTEFNVSDFRRRRAGSDSHSVSPPVATNEPQPTAQPYQHYEPSEEVPPVQSIPDAVPNPYAAALASPAAPVAPVFVQPPAHVSNLSQPQPSLQVGAPEAEQSSSVLTDLLEKLKSFRPSKSEAANGSDQTIPAHTPVMFSTDAYEAPEQQAAPVAYTPPAEPESPLKIVKASVPVEMMVQTKPAIPVWAAFGLGFMVGVILTFGALAFMSKSDPNNTLEAKFGQRTEASQPMPSLIDSVDASPETVGKGRVVPAGL